jgi:hypothetical protein
VVWAIGVGGLLALNPDVAAQPAPSPDTIRHTTEEILDRPEFRPQRSGKGTWLGRILRDFMDWLGGLAEAAPILFWLLLILCIAALLAVVILMVLQFRSVFTRSYRDRQASAEAAALRRGMAATYRREAEQCASAGDFTEAVRFLFLSLVYRLDERGRVSLHQAYTNREYLELLEDRLPARDSLRIIVDTLDDHWYGQRPCDRSQYEACLAVYERIAALT